MIESIESTINPLMLVTHICVSRKYLDWFKWSPVWGQPYLNQWWLIDNWTLGNKFNYNLNQNTTMCISGNSFEYVVYKMADTLCRTECMQSCNQIKINYVFCCKGTIRYEIQATCKNNDNWICKIKTFWCYENKCASKKVEHINTRANPIMVK